MEADVPVVVSVVRIILLVKRTPLAKLPGIFSVFQMSLINSKRSCLAEGVLAGHVRSHAHALDLAGRGGPRAVRAGAGAAGPVQ